MTDNANKLSQRLHKLSDRDQTFAKSLLDAAASGRASAKQLEWIDKLLERTQDAVTLVAPRTMALLAKARASGVERIRVRLAHSTLRMGRNGVVYMNDNTRTYVDRNTGDERPVTLATINPPDGAITVSRYASKEAINTAIEELLAFDENPAKVAKLQGHATSHCIFCGRRLDTAISVHHGYGPICAMKYNLPWNTGNATDNLRKAVE